LIDTYFYGDRVEYAFDDASMRKMIRLDLWRERISPVNIRYTPVEETIGGGLESPRRMAVKRRSSAGGYRQTMRLSVPG
jgi:hypothetical protein